MIIYQCFKLYCPGPHLRRSIQHLCGSLTKQSRERFPSDDEDVEDEEEEEEEDEDDDGDGNLDDEMVMKRPMMLWKTMMMKKRRGAMMIIMMLVNKMKMLLLKTEMHDNILVPLTSSMTNGTFTEQAFRQHC